MARCRAARRHPRAYWAALTHPNATQAIIREAFREVHMLSHLVGAANRADIRRLHQLEADNAELQARLDRQQLARPRGSGIAGRNHPRPSADTDETNCRRTMRGDDDSAVLRQLVADLERRMTNETRRGLVLGERLIETRADLAAERSARSKAERDRRALQQELDAHRCIGDGAMQPDHARSRTAATIRRHTALCRWTAASGGASPRCSGTFRLAIPAPRRRHRAPSQPAGRLDQSGRPAGVPGRLHKSSRRTDSEASVPADQQAVHPAAISKCDVTACRAAATRGGCARRSTGSVTINQRHPRSAVSRQPLRVADRTFPAARP